MDHQYIFEKTLEDKLSASGINMIRINSKPDHKIISKYNISGMILIDSFPGLESLPVPSVLINRYGIRFPMYSCVECDELAGFVDGFKFLKEKGHRRIALFWEKQIRPIDKHARKCHPKDAYELNDLPYDKELVCAEDFVSGKHDLVIEKAVERWFSLQEPPTAIFSIGDTYVPAIYESLKKRGLKVPEDVSVMGYDNAPVCEMLYPKLTTVRKPMGKMAQEALKLLLSRINNRNPETENIIRILVRPDLVVRESVRDFLNP
jgi:DNA-binding LacI/PurR family transcriptional regulator